MKVVHPACEIWGMIVRSLSDKEAGEESAVEQKFEFLPVGVENS